MGTSALWSAANAGMLRLAMLLVSLVIARLVAPFDFGVFVVAVTVFNIVMSISELGVSSAIVREPERSREIAPTIFTLSLLTSGVLALLMVVFAPFISQQLGARDAATAVRVLAIFVLLSGFSAVPAALMSRDFMQRERFITDVAFFVSSTAAMLVLVLGGHPIMGLALSRVVGQVVTVVLIMWMAPERYWPGFRRSEARRLLAFGLPLGASNFVNLAIANVDFIVVGRLLRAQKLGYYNLAFNISGWPVSIFSAVLISVTLPTLSRVRDSPRDLTRHLEAGLSAVVAASFPVSALFVGLAGPLIDTVYGSRWHNAWTALIVLSIFGAARTVLTLFSDLAIALGMTRRLLMIQLVWMVALVPAMVLGVEWWGITGAGVAHAVVVVAVVIPLYLYTIKRHTPISLDFVRRALVRPLIASIGCGTAAAVVSRLVPYSSLQLVAGLVAGLATYVLLAGTWLRRVARTLRTMYWSQDAVEVEPSPDTIPTVAVPDAQLARVRQVRDNGVDPASPWIPQGLVTGGPVSDSTALETVETLKTVEDAIDRRQYDPWPIFPANIPGTDKANP